MDTAKTEELKNVLLQKNLVYLACRLGCDSVLAQSFIKHAEGRYFTGKHIGKLVQEQFACRYTLTEGKTAGWKLVQVPGRALRDL